MLFRSSPNSAQTLAWDSVNMDLMGARPRRVLSRIARMSSPPPSPPRRNPVVYSNPSSPGRTPPTPSPRSNPPGYNDAVSLSPPPDPGDPPPYGAAANPYVTDAILEEEMRSLREFVENACLRVQDSLASRMPMYIQSAENRITNSVLNTVANEYNRVGIGCKIGRAHV